VTPRPRRRRRRAVASVLPAPWNQSMSVPPASGGGSLSTSSAHGAPRDICRTSHSFTMPSAAPAAKKAKEITLATSHKLIFLEISYFFFFKVHIFDFDFG
jgi:hypothetical protein